MSDASEEKRRSWTSWGGIVLLVLALYPLSVGPAGFLQGIGLLGDRAVETLRVGYTPLIMLAQGVPSFGMLMGRYESGCRELGAKFHR